PLPICLPKLHHGRYRMRHIIADEIFSVTGRGNRASAIVGICARTNDRGIPHPIPPLVGHPSGGSGGSQIPVLIEGHGPHRTVLLIGRLSLILEPFEVGLPPALRKKPTGIHGLHPLLAGKRLDRKSTRLNSSHV